jgi:hypothetical protein
VKNLADATGVGEATIKRYELNVGVPKSRMGHLEKLQEAFEAAGIEFIGKPDDAPGIRIHKK